MAAADQASERGPVLVDPAVSAAKVARQLDDWRANEASYVRRGWRLEQTGELTVEVAFATRLPAGSTVFPAVTACIGLSFDNYDLWPPSVEFLDYFTREPTPPVLGALTWEGGEQRNVAIFPHPETRRHFLCLPGVREYHAHHEHSGDHWLLHRGQGAGTLVAICEEIWQRMVRNVIGLQAIVNHLVIPNAAGPGGARLESSQVLLVQQPVEPLQQQVAQLPAAQREQIAQ